MMQGPPHLPNRLPMPIHTFYHQPYSQSFQPSPPSTSPSTSPTTSPPRSLSHRYARLQQRQVNPQKVEAIDPRTQWSQFSQQPIYQDQSQSIASEATAVPRSTHAPRAFRRASLNERDEKQDEESVIVIRNGKQSSAAAPVRANVPAVSPPPPVVPASALPSTVHLSPQMQQQFLQQFYMQQLFLQQQQQQQQMQLQSQMPYPQLYNQMNMFAQQQQQQQQQQQSRPFSTPQVLPPPQFLYQPATSPTGPVGSWARKSGPTSTTTNTTRTIGLQQHSMTSTPVDCVPNRPQSTPIAPPSKVPLSNQFPLHSPPPPSTNTAHYPVPLAITYRVNSKPPSSSYIIPTRKNQPATAASTASNYSSNSSTNYHTRESSPSPSDTMDDPFPARPSHLDTSASSDGSEFDASDDDLEFVNEQSYSASQNQQPNTNNDDDDEEFHRQNDSFIDGLVSSFSNKVGMARRPGLNVVVSLPQGSPQSSKASPPPPPAESRSRSRSTCRSNSRPTSRGTTASMQQRPASTNGLSQAQARREAALKFASSLSNVPRRSTATDSSRPSGSDSTTPTGASAIIARPRTTIGGARSSREVVASSTRPTSRVGSADWTRSRSRPRSSNNMQQTMNAAAREAAAVFFQQNQNESGSPTSPAPAYNSFSKRHLSPPACTLSLQGSIFYNRLPDEMWIAIMQFLDVSTLLTTVSRLDTASKRLIADQEVWRNVSLASTLLSQPSSSNSSRLSSSMGELAFSTISSEIALQKLMNVSMRWTLLESLDLSGVGACIKDDFFLKLEQTVIPYWKLSLRNLSLARCAQITDVTLLLLADVCTQLDRLDLSWCQLCTDVGFDAIIRSCATTLTVAIFNRCHGLTDQTVETLASHATALLELDLTFCSNVTDHALEVLASDQSTCFYPARPVQSETALLTSVAPLYIGLQKLSLRWCRKITDAGIKFLMNGGVKPVAPIESLLPVGVPGENSAMIANPPAMIPTQVPIDPSAVRSNSLKTLILDHCSLLTDASFMHLSRSATQLTTLSAIYCKQLTPASLHYLIAGSVSQLTTLILDHCDVFHNYFCRKNAAVVTSVLSCPAFNHLTLLSWKTCAHAGRERSNHLEIEAECASHAAPVSKSHSRHNARTLICTSVSATAGNVLSWIKRK